EKRVVPLEEIGIPFQVIVHVSVRQGFPGELGLSLRAHRLRSPSFLYERAYHGRGYARLNGLLQSATVVYIKAPARDRVGTTSITPTRELRGYQCAISWS